MNEVAYQQPNRSVADRIGDAFAVAANRDPIRATGAILSALRTIAIETSDTEFVGEELEALVVRLETI